MNRSAFRFDNDNGGLYGVAMSKVRKTSQDPNPTVRLKPGQDIHLSLFDPTLPELQIGEKPAGPPTNKPQCRCTVRVRDVDDDGLVVSLPDCFQSRQCMLEDRRLYALLDDIGRHAFATQVMPLGDDLSETDGMVRLSRPSQVKSCQRRRHFRTNVYPTRQRFVYAWPLKKLDQAEAAVRAYLRGEPWDDEHLALSCRQRRGRAVLLDMSLRGAGLALGLESPAQMPPHESLLLLRFHLDPERLPLVCPVRVRWSKDMSPTLVHLGVEMILGRYPSLESIIDHDIAHWLADMQRENLSAKKIGGVACRSLCRED